MMSDPALDYLGSSGEMMPSRSAAPPEMSAGGNSGDDMTEDEVASMVKNALRKARRAMNNSSPLNTSMSSSEEWSEPNFSTFDQNKITKTKKENAARGAPKSTDDEADELAKRIQAEINSARAFAEHAYFEEAESEKKKAGMSPVAAANPKSVDEEKDTTKTSSHKSLPSPLGYGTLPSRSRRKAARKLSSPRHVNTSKTDDADKSSQETNTTSAPTQRMSSTLSPRHRKRMYPKTMGSPRNEGKGTDLLLHQHDKPINQTPDKSVSDFEEIPAGCTSPDKTDTRKNEKDNENKVIIDEKKQQSSGKIDEHISPKSTTRPKSSVSSVLSNKSNISTPTSQVNTSTNFNDTKLQPSENRQVVFRHPYPIPPPPSAPRSDDVIIDENTAPEKTYTIKVVQPDAELEKLIQQTQDEHNIVRRSNACGAIKVLASRDTQKAKLARTEGLLNALVYASLDDAVDSDALDARTRAVTALLYLCEPKDNRIVLAKHPGVLDVLMKVIEEDTGEARLRACSALAILAKTPQNRSIICQKDNLAVLLSELMVRNVTKNEERVEEDIVEEKIDSKSESRDEGTTEIGQSFSNSFSGTFSEKTEESGYGSGSFSEDESYHTDSYGSSQDDRSVFSSDKSISQDRSASYDRSMSSEDMSRASQCVDSRNEHESVGEEEGVEMQISSLKKLNIENSADFLQRSQLSSCATLTHLTKDCANAPLLCNNTKVLDNVIILAGILDHPLHTRCFEMLCNLSRFPSNNTKLASMSKVVETLILGGKSKLAEDRLWSIRTIQNLCSDASSKAGLATGTLLSLLSACAMRKEYEEQLAAVGALMNLATEPGSIVPLTNTKTVVATLVHLAHSPNTPSQVRKIACDSLATIGLWLQTLASAGTVPDSCSFSFLPTHSATGWLRWD